MSVRTICHRVPKLLLTPKILYATRISVVAAFPRHYPSPEYLSTLPPRKNAFSPKTAVNIPRLYLPAKFSKRSLADDRPEKPPERERVLTVPNLLSASRIALAPYISYLIVAEAQYEWALAFFGYAGLTDLLDGYIARNFKGQASMFGSFLDPLADKILVVTLYLSLTWVNLIPAALASLVISRDVLLVYAGLYIRYMGVKPPFTIKKYFDLSLPSAQVNPTLISKINTGFQLTLIGCALAAPIFKFTDHPAFHGLCLVTAGTTFASAVSYAFMRDTYSFKHRSYDHQFGKKLTAFVAFILFNASFLYFAPPSGATQDSNREGKN